MELKRLLKHACAGRGAVQRAFPAPVLSAIQEEIAASERQHGGEIRFALENSLNPLAVWRGVTPRQRAIEVFANLGVWDTEHNNGVLIYVLWADRDVEIVADRGFNGRVTDEQWAEVCRLMEQQFARREWHAAVTNGIRATGVLIARHFPTADRNELPDHPIML
jgi:uncharacterized membrane protein YgcG